MNQSAEAAKAFLEAQKAFGPALKTSVNPHLKSKYAALDACVEAVIDALHANGLSLIQRPCMADRGIAVQTVFLHSSGDIVDGGTFSMPFDTDNPQKYCAALTYARRHGLMAACGIAPEDDDGQSVSSVSRLQMIKSKFEQVKDMDELKVLWMGLPLADKPTYEPYKNAAKARLEGEKK